jgi:hypothetical protein
MRMKKYSLALCRLCPQKRLFQLHLKVVCEDTKKALMPNNLCLRIANLKNSSEKSRLRTVFDEIVRVLGQI